MKNRSLLVMALVAGAASACNRPAALTQLVDARRLASELHVQFTHAADAANRAVMADTDDASTAAANEARGARQAVEKNVQTLRPMLESLGYRDDLRHLEAFTSRFAEYRQLDDEILSLAVENSNLKAQRLSFGPAQQAAVAFQLSVDAAVQRSAAKEKCTAAGIGARARIARARASSNAGAAYRGTRRRSDDAHGRRDGRSRGCRSESTRRTEGRASTGCARPTWKRPATAFARFMAIHGEIIALSRRNSNVRSLALSLGRKRTITAACEEQLQALDTALSSHAYNATR